MNMNNLMNMIKSAKNPNTFMMNMVNSNPTVKNNPLMQNALNMMKNGNVNGIELMARNLCKEHGVDADDMVKQINNMMK